MSDGRTHERLNLLFFILLMNAGLAAALYAAYGVTGLYFTLMLSIGYWVGTYYMNPDLDIKSRPYNRWKWLRFIWIPYQRLGHRSVWTHGILIGDVIRYAYFTAFLILLFGAWTAVTGFPFLDALSLLLTRAGSYQTELLLFFAGNCLSSIAHIIADRGSSNLKRLFK